VTMRKSREDPEVTDQHLDNTEIMILCEKFNNVLAQIAMSLISCYITPKDILKLSQSLT
jgi:hypothetical protein